LGERKVINDYAAKLATVITDYSTKVSDGDFVVIIGNMESIPLVEALFEAVMKRGGHPSVTLRASGISELFYTLAADDQLDFLDPIAKLVIEDADVILQIAAPTNTKSLASSDPGKMAHHQQTMKPLMETQLRRMGDNSLRWCLMPWPTEGAAQQADMGIHAYTEFLYKACGLDRDNPAQYWQTLRDQQLRLVSTLNEKEHMVVRGPGIDLSFSIKGRTWVSCHGNVNFPDG
jgi:aminopeptidase